MVARQATVAVDADTLLVRLKPYNPRRKHVLRTFTYKGQRFQEARGWHKVPSWLGEELREIPQIESDPASPFAFDVCTLAEAERMDDDEDKRRRLEVERRLARDAAPIERRSAISARDAGRINNVTAADLPSTKESRYAEEGTNAERVHQVRTAPRPAEQPEGVVTTNDLGRATRAARDNDGEEVLESADFDAMMNEAGVAEAAPEPPRAAPTSPAARPLPATLPKATRRKRGGTKHAEAGSAGSPATPDSTSKDDSNG